MLNVALQSKQLALFEKVVANRNYIPYDREETQRKKRNVEKAKSYVTSCHMVNFSM